MNPERFRRIEDLFHRALALPGGERASFLESECKSDRDLCSEVERLLLADAHAAEGVEKIELFATGADPLIGRQLGAWRILERLAGGGMGVVYRAERADGLYDQKVAIKLLRVEAASDDALRRFDLERRLLARLEHPHIARLFDGGRSEQGTPYLVMEFIDGLPIDGWCDEQRLSIEQRLRLFAATCRAVHFAHRSLVVHRDLKPSNIMVDRRGEPKLLDFGIARLMDEEDALPTHTAARALTPLYASPEQLQGLTLTTATDVYSLGVVLYELLTGRRPWSSTGRSPAEWERVVSSERPTRPSSAVIARADEADAFEFAARLATTPARLQRRLRGDLDRIVLMALRKEPERRYASAEQLAEDIERYLAGKPVRARRDTFGYRAQRFVQRNRLGVGAAALVLLAMCGGLFASWRARLQAEDSAALARAEEAKALRAAEHAGIEAESFRLIADFLGATFLQTVGGDPERETVSESVERQAAQVRRQYADRPHLLANLIDALGRVYAQLDLVEPAGDLLREARDIRLATFGERTMEHALSLTSLGRLAYQRGEFDQAVELLAGSLKLHRALVDDVHSDVAAAANDLAAALRNLGHLEEARVLHEEALALRRAEGGEDSLPLAESLNNLALVLLDQGELDEARKLTESSLEIRERILGVDHALTLQARISLAGVAWRLERLDEAERHLLEAAEGYRALREEGRDGLVHALANLAALEIRRGKLDAAEASAREALELTRERYGDHPQTVVALSHLAEVRSRRGEHDAAREAWQEVLRVRRAAYPPGHPLLVTTLHQVALAHLRGGRPAEAEPLLEEALEWLERSPSASTHARERANVVLSLGVCTLELGRPGEAREHLADAKDAFLRLDGEDSDGAERASTYLSRLDG